MAATEHRGRTVEATMPSTDPFDFPPPGGSWEVEMAEKLRQVHTDPAWDRLRRAVEAYEAVSPRGGMYLDEDGACYWEPAPDFAERSRPALEELLAARLELRQHHDASPVDRAMIEAQDGARQDTGYRPGTDVDGYSHYEPHGDLDTALWQAVKGQETMLHHGHLPAEQLRTMITGLGRQIEEEARGDNFTTMARLREETRHLEGLLARRTPPTTQPPTTEQPSAAAPSPETALQRYRAPRMPTADQRRVTPYGVPAGLRNLPLPPRQQVAMNALRARMDTETRDPLPPSQGAAAESQTGGYRLHQSARRASRRRCGVHTPEPAQRWPQPVDALPSCASTSGNVSTARPRAPRCGPATRE